MNAVNAENAVNTTVDDGLDELDFEAYLYDGLETLDEYFDAYDDIPYDEAHDLALFMNEGHNCRVLAERAPFLPADEYADIPF